MVLPIVDGGSPGIRRVHTQDLMLSNDYYTWPSSYGPSKQSRLVSIDILFNARLQHTPMLVLAIPLRLYTIVKSAVEFGSVLTIKSHRAYY